MKRYIFSLFCLCIGFCLLAQDKIHWVSMADLPKLMEKEKKKVIIDVYTTWCGPCRMLNQQTFANPEIIRYINEQYYAVKFNAEGNDVFTFHGKEFKNTRYNPNGRSGSHPFTGYIATVKGKVAYPTIVYLDESLRPITAMQGFVNARQIEPILHFFAEDEYKKGGQEIYDAYVKSFQSSIK